MKASFLKRHFYHVSVSLLYFLLFTTLASSQDNNNTFCQTEECFYKAFTKLVSSPDNNITVCRTKGCLYTAKILKESINWNVNPCDNFYQYACGNFPNHHNNYEFTPESPFKLRYKENLAEIIDFLKQKNTDEEPVGVHKARKLFSLCTSNDSFSNNSEPIRTILEQIGIPMLPIIPGEDRYFDYPTILARVNRLTGIKVQFDVGIGLHPFDRMKNIITIRTPKMLAEMGYTPKTKTRLYESIVRTELNETTPELDFIIKVADRLCKGDNKSSVCQKWASYTDPSVVKLSFAESVIHSDYEYYENIVPARDLVNAGCNVQPLYNLEQLQSFTDAIAIEINPFLPKMNWTRYIEELYIDRNHVITDLSDPKKVEIAIEDVDLFKSMLTFFYRNKKLHDIEAEVWWRVVSTFLSYQYADIFDTKNKVLHLVMIPTREQRCATLTMEKFDVALSYMYTKKDKYIKALDEIVKMYESIRGNFMKTVQQTLWIDETTKQKLDKKLHWVYYYMVYPDILKNLTHLNNAYKDINMSSNFYEYMTSIIQHRISKELLLRNKMNNLNDESHLGPSTSVIAYYEANRNHIVIPGGLLGGAIYTNGLKAWDYGSLGSIIGHELTHIFDYTGHCRDFLGNHDDWWDAETWTWFQKKALCFVLAYSNYSTLINGKTLKSDSLRTFNGDISDNVGFEEALFAYRTNASKLESKLFLPDFGNYTHEQLFTLAFANIWCENPSVAYYEDVHYFSPNSPNEIRVNGVLRNSKEFSDIWKCSNDSYMNPSDTRRCSIW